MSRPSSPQANDTPPGCEAEVALLTEAGAARRAEGRRIAAENERNDPIWEAICGARVDPLTALMAIRDYVKPISPGTAWADVVVRIAEDAIARAEKTT